ncbi:conserved hypothetical protein [Candidatus Brocadia pituitae]|nr:conserved hypothetical protein [Candidatus Brocadia pituitae]
MKDKSTIIDVMFRSASGLSLSDRRPGIKEQDISLYVATEETKKQAVLALRQLGFEIIGPATNFGVSISSSPQLIREVFGEGELKVPKSLVKWIESVRIPPPGEFYSKK